MINRKNTSKIVSEWKDFLNGKSHHSGRRSLNEAPDDMMGDDMMDDEMMDDDRSEEFKALISFYQEAGLSDVEIDDFIKACERMSNETIKAMNDANDIEVAKDDVLDDESEEWMADSDVEDNFIEREPLENDDDLGM